MQKQNWASAAQQTLTEANGLTGLLNLFLQLASKEEKKQQGHASILESNFSVLLFHEAGEHPERFKLEDPDQGDI